MATRLQDMVQSGELALSVGWASIRVRGHGMGSPRRPWVSVSALGSWAALLRGWRAPWPPTACTTSTRSSGDGCTSTKCDWRESVWMKRELRMLIGTMTTIRYLLYFLYGDISTTFRLDYIQNYYLSNSCIGGCDTNSHCEWGMCECNAGTTRR